MHHRAATAARLPDALVHGFATYETEVTVAGVILNKVGSERQETELRSAVAGIGIPVLGALRSWIATGVDLDAVVVGIDPPPTRR